MTGASLAYLRCPRCQSSLRQAAPDTDDVDRIECVGCGASYPVRWGIADLRGSATDPYLTVGEDLRSAEKLWTESQRSGFADTLESYYRSNARVTAAQARQFARGAIAGEWRSEGVLRDCMGVSGVPARGHFLDVGCGTGSLALAASRAGFDVTGVDIGMRWLVLAGVRAREAAASISFVCADAAHLPVADASADVVASEGLLENLPSAMAALGEAARVLRSGGYFWTTTANRWSVGPDPHIGLPLGGWFGEGFARRYATWRGMVPPHRRLLDQHAIRALLSSARLRERLIAPTPIADAQRDGAPAVVRLGVDGYRWVTRMAVGRSLLRAIGPSLLVVAERAD